MLAYTGYISAGEYAARKRREWDAVRATKAQHRKLKRVERIAKDLDEVERKLRAHQRPLSRGVHRLRSTMHLLKRRNKLVAMLEAADRA